MGKTHRAASEGNPYLDKLLANSDGGEKYKAELDDLKGRGYSPIKIDEKFEKAGMIHEYKSVYGLLCSHAHGDILALVDRHVSQDEHESVFWCLKKRPLEDFHMHIGICTELLVRSTQLIHQFFDSNAQNEVEIIRKKLDVIRGEAI